jgi:hypothetical protein
MVKMSIYKVIANVKARSPMTKIQASTFLATLSELEQRQLIAALYIGREHVHASRWNSTKHLSVKFIDHIQFQDYSRILYEKTDSARLYLDSIERCAKAMNFDLNDL